MDLTSRVHHKEGVIDVPLQGRSISAKADRSRRIRHAVEAALSDIIFLGTEDQVRLAATAAAELAAGRPVHTAELVISLRSFIRQVLDLDPVPKDLSIPKQGLRDLLAVEAARKVEEERQEKAVEERAAAHRLAAEPGSAWAAEWPSILTSTIEAESMKVN